MALYAVASLMTAIALAFVATPLVGSRCPKNGARNPALLGVIVVFGLGLALYGAIGRPDVRSHTPSFQTTTANTHARSNDTKAAPVSSLLSGLEKRLDENPQDGKGWLLLAQSYELLGRFDESTAAYKNAVALGTSNDDLAARLYANSVTATERRPEE